MNFMKIRVTIMVWVLFFTYSSFSQTVLLVKQFGTKAYCIKTDKNANFYITGSFENSVNFDDKSITSCGMTDMFLSKYTPDGNLIWVKTAGGKFYDEGYSLVANPVEDNIYVTGFMRDATFDNTVVTGYPFFIANYDSSGILKWAQSLKSAGGGVAPSITTDSHGQLYLTGCGLIIPDSIKVNDGWFFIITYDKSGNYLWIKRNSHTSNIIAIQPLGITCDNNDNVYIAGGIQSEPIEFDSTHILIPEGNVNLFVVKYDSIGNVMFAIQSKGPGTLYPTSIATDTANNIYLTGCFEGSAKFGDITISSFGSFDIFTVKYDKNGEFVWVRQAGSNQYDSGKSIKVDDDGNVYVIGINSLLASFDGSVINNGGAFLAKYNRDGNLFYVKSIFHVDENRTVSGNNFTVKDFELVGNKNILFIGFVNETVYFDSLQTNSLDAGNSFVAEIINNTTRVEDNDPIPSSIILYQNYPNPFNSSTTIEYEIPKLSHVKIDVYDVLGRRIVALIDKEHNAGNYSITFNDSKLSSGIYFYKITAGNFIQTKKMILLK
jgi:hypothetical protein